MLKKSNIDLTVDSECIPMEKFLSFIEQVKIKFEEATQRTILLERSIAISSDEIKDYKKSLDKTRSMALQTSKMAAIGEMASNISHEINNPLSIISGSAEVISQIIEDVQYDQDEKALTLRHIDTIHKTTQRISKIILGLKRLSNSKMEYQYKKEKIIDVIEESFSIGLESLKKDHIIFSYNYDSNIKDIMLDIPSVEFSQVIINLFTNAKQALEELEPTSKKELIINCNVIDNIFKIEVINSGNPIPPEIHDKIFDSFFTTKPVGKGSGIGLNISKRIIEEMNGRLYLDKSYKSPKFVIELQIEPQIIPD